MGIWRLFMRIGVGALLIGHGTQKLLGWFGGEGIGGTAKTFEKIGLRPARPNAVAAGVAEAGGGALLAVGLEPPLGAAIVTGAMLTAIRRVHQDKGPWNQNGGYEYPAVLIGLALALVEAGPGPLALDRALGRRHRGIAWAAIAFGAGSAGAYVVDRIAEHNRSAPTQLRPAEQERAAA
jgi:putative oxidoreductase